ncbi:ribonuclease H [Candidatus Falkowbacteria bacterium CG10_big_fil_rev_8_21_14_0_10_37_14]|uniref:Ribonuclease H n=1 Tax=Candidatus Falkowbacteria bacterium CG10_big_fil_rev_8_21_14_0_10_37_14 TaxID=1974561 RepID=A0A2M6WTF3_9BACT|nr:ribonuclease HI family protein [Candidatus Falkowbacteria bacterium]PIT96074.1 MAG: ribonuclease H [Candidatus Falkowbacteria bacterium CG10_big_fil_rev_8_21_14_0_10_37_14]
MAKLIIHTDGGARGNPGPAGCGAVLVWEGGKEPVVEISYYMGVATNNQAEYTAIVLAIEKAKELGATELDFYLDSELAVKQLNREYKVKNKELEKLFVLVYNKSQHFKKVTFTHIRREFNKEADILANKAMDKGR